MARGLRMKAKTYFKCWFFLTDQTPSSQLAPAPAFFLGGAGTPYFLAAWLAPQSQGGEGESSQELLPAGYKTPHLSKGCQRLRDHWRCEARELSSCVGRAGRVIAPAFSLKILPARRSEAMNLLSPCLLITAG